MAAGATYTPIATTTLGANSATITFSSISSSYTDLRVVLVGLPTTANAVSCTLQFNSDTATNYSWTRLTGDGTSAASVSLASSNYISINSFLQFSSTIPNMITADIFSYAGSTYKTVLGSAVQNFNGSGNILNMVGLWRNTTAINRIDINATGGSFATSTIATLYGIKAA